MEEKCSVNGCEHPAIMVGVCKIHYSRKQKTGSYELTTLPSSARTARYMMWRTINKRYPEGNGWDSFDDFDKSVGARPAINYMLVKASDDAPIGPTNFCWRLRSEVIPKKSAHDWGTRAGRRAAKKASYDPIKKAGKTLLSNYGISIDHYKQMLLAQNGVCAICERPETLVKRGKIISLSVDHDHETGTIRGLLCNTCNRGLGLFCDDVGYLESAKQYLQRNNRESNVVSLARSRG
jgi:hypothetical protein